MEPLSGRRCRGVRGGGAGRLGHYVCGMCEHELALSLILLCRKKFRVRLKLCVGGGGGGA